MSVDEKIEDVRKTIAKIHRGLYKFNQQLNGTVTGLSTALSTFDQEIQRISGSVSAVRNDVSTILKHLPEQSTYVAVLTVLDVIIWLIVIFLIYYLVKYWRNRSKRRDNFIKKFSGQKTPPLAPTFLDLPRYTSLDMLKSDIPELIPSIIPASLSTSSVCGAAVQSAYYDNRTLPLYSKVNTGNGTFESTYGIPS